MRTDAERRGAERERFSEEEEGSTKKDQWETSENTKLVEIFSPTGSVSRYVYCRLLVSDYPFCYV